MTALDPSAARGVYKMEETAAGAARVCREQSRQPSRHCGDCRTSNGKPHTAACHPSSITDAAC
jgi:hypothetical protein